MQRPPRKVPYVLITTGKRPRSQPPSPDRTLLSFPVSTTSKLPTPSPLKKLKHVSSHPEKVDAVSCKDIELGFTTVERTASASSLGTRLDSEYSSERYTIIPGESTDVEEEDDKTLPIRILEEFYVYDRSSQELIPFEALPYKSEEYHVVGIASAVSADGTSNSGDGFRIRLSGTKELDVHFYYDETDTFDKDIWVKTETAWYIMKTPAAIYKPFYSPFQRRHATFDLALTTFDIGGDVEYTTFMATLRGKGFIDQDSSILPDDVIAYIEQHIEGNLTPSQFDSISSLTTTSQRILSFRHLKRESVDEVDVDTDAGTDEYKASDSEEESFSDSDNDPRPVTTHKRISSIRKTATTERVVTPRVAQIAQRLYRDPMAVEGSATFRNDLDAKIASAVDHQLNDENPIHKCWEGEGKRVGDVVYYSAITIDGTLYQAGDNVMVKPQADYDDDVTEDDSDDDTTTDNEGPMKTYADTAWFCQIWYFFEDTDGMKFHAQWYQHGSKTILRETTHSRSLYRLNQCDDLFIDCIYCACNVETLDVEHSIPEDTNSGSFHCSLVWDEEDCSFTDLPSADDFKEMADVVEAYQLCWPCYIQNRDKFISILRGAADTFFALHAIDYHIDDFIYLVPDEKYLSSSTAGARLDVAQILSIHSVEGSLSITVRLYDHADDFPEHKRNGQYESRRLVRQKNTTVFKYDDIHHFVTGKCFVQHFDEDDDELADWCTDDNHFFVSSKMKDADNFIPLPYSNFTYCEDCLLEHTNFLKRRRDMQCRASLRGLELFSGAGGLGLGLQSSGFVDPRWAIELMPAAAKTYQQVENHPDCAVYNIDVNIALKNAIDTDNGVEAAPIVSVDGKHHKMPGRNEVDILFGGAPCQAFSGANHTKLPDDPRSMLPVTMLSYVEHYRPRYFLLENVPGIFGFPLMSKLVGRRLVGGFKMGVVKLICRVLIELGYQVRFKVLQAAQHGACQERKRVFFWGALRGHQIPEFPVPMYAYNKGASGLSRKLPHGFETTPTSWRPGHWDEEMKRVVRQRDSCHQCAPYNAISISDAINDLPSFEWLNPHTKIPATTADIQDERHRRDVLRIQPFNATDRSRLPGYLNPVDYKCSPKHEYQYKMREYSKQVSLHYTKAYNPNTIEVVCNIPIASDQRSRDNVSHKRRYHKHIPENRASILLTVKKRESDNVFFGRLGQHGFFSTALTDASPSNKSTYSLHPSQRRTYSLREILRSQGFPDHYVIPSGGDPNVFATNVMKQVGNAVPVPLARAMGHCLGDALLKSWKTREYSPEV